MKSNFGHVLKGEKDMPKKIEKRAFLFYASTLEILEQFPPERQRKIAMALINYGLEDYYDFGEFSGILSTLSPLERIAFRPVIREIDVQRRRYHNKKLIKGAIETIQNEIYSSLRLDKEERRIYIDLIGVLQEKYEFVIKHDSFSLQEELKVLLPEQIYELFHRRYEIKLWRDQINYALDGYIRKYSITISGDDKKNILDRLIKEYVEKGTISNMSDLINQYYEELLETE